MGKTGINVLFSFFTPINYGVEYKIFIICDYTVKFP